jgi:hypothetical protein
MALGEVTVPAVDLAEFGDLPPVPPLPPPPGDQVLPPQPIDNPGSPHAWSEAVRRWPRAVSAAALAAALAALGAYARHSVRDRQRDKLLDEIVSTRVAAMRAGGGGQPSPQRQPGESRPAAAEIAAAEADGETVAVDERRPPAGHRSGRLPLEVGETQ